MRVIEAIKKRRSIRRFDHQKKITEKQIEQLLEAARWAPSAGNLQSRYLFVILDPKTKIRLSLAALGQLWLAKAPLMIVICANLKKSAARYGNRGRELYAIQDATLAGQNIWLAATAMGLGGVWVGAFSEKMVSRILKLKNHLRPVAILPIGHPLKTPSTTSRLPLEKISQMIK